MHEECPGRSRSAPVRARLGALPWRCRGSLAIRSPQAGEHRGQLADAARVESADVRVEEVRVPRERVVRFRLSPHPARARRAIRFSTIVFAAGLEWAASLLAPAAVEEYPGREFGRLTIGCVTERSRMKAGTRKSYRALQAERSARMVPRGAGRVRVEWFGATRKPRA